MRCPQDIQEIAPDVLRHRLVLSYEALADGVTADDIIDRILAGRARSRARAQGAHDPGRRLTPSDAMERTRTLAPRRPSGSSAASSGR